MPRIGEAFGLVFCVYFFDHNPPHMHVIYGDNEAELDLATGELVAGSLPGAKLRQARVWLTENQALALAAWQKLNPREEAP